MRVDVVVIGAGAAGSSSAWQLARRGHSVALLERFPRGHAWGSSHGATRIFRVSYREPIYSALAGRAIPLWRELEEAAGVPLLEQTGQLDHGLPRAIDEIEANLDAGGWAFARMSPDEAHERWPGMVFDAAVVYSPDGGRIFADLTVDSLITLTEQLGGQVRFGSPVLDIAPDGDGVRVSTRDETFEADTVVVSVGAWLTTLPGLDDFGVRLPSLRVTAQQPAHFAIRPGFSFPSYVHHVDSDSTNHTFAYGAYGLESPGEGVKVGLDTDLLVAELDARSLDISERYLAEAASYAEQWLPGADTAQGSAVSCLFTMTDESHFIIDRRGPIVVASPCSGHGFKFTPLIGSIVADLATGVGHGIDAWRLPAAAAR